MTPSTTRNSGTVKRSRCVPSSKKLNCKRSQCRSFVPLEKWSPLKDVLVGIQVVKTEQKVGPFQFEGLSSFLLVCNWIWISSDSPSDETYSSVSASRSRMLSMLIRLKEGLHMLSFGQNLMCWFQQQITEALELCN